MIPGRPQNLDNCVEIKIVRTFVVNPKFTARQGKSSWGFLRFQLIEYAEYYEKKMSWPILVKTPYNSEKKLEMVKSIHHMWFVICNCG